MHNSFARLQGSYQMNQAGWIEVELGSWWRGWCLKARGWVWGQPLTPAPSSPGMNGLWDERRSGWFILFSCREERSHNVLGLKPGFHTSSLLFLCSKSLLNGSFKDAYISDSVAFRTLRYTFDITPVHFSLLHGSKSWKRPHHHFGTFSTTGVNPKW